MGVLHFLFYRNRFGGLLVMESKENNKVEDKSRLSDNLWFRLIRNIVIIILVIISLIYIFFLPFTFPDNTIIKFITETLYEYTGIIWGPGMCQGDKKPVIYLYSDEDGKEVSVRLITDNEITCEYPKMSNGEWKVIANKDGVIKDDLGTEYNYLYWEGISDTAYDFSTGFCVKGEDSAKFLEDSLNKLGLNRKEANEFIVYWLPILEANKYNLISFQTDVYENAYKLNISPAPERVLRVFMAVKPLEEAINIIPQDLEIIRGNFIREGFYVVEWGGSYDGEAK